MIINDRIVELVKQIDATDTIHEELTHKIQELIRELTHSCNEPNNQQRYIAYKEKSFDLGRYPIDADGFAHSFDPLLDEKGFFECFETYGMVVGKSVISSDLCTATVKRIQQVAHDISNGTLDIMDPSTYAHIPHDTHGTPFISRGFFELYHDDILAQIRQSVRLYIHHVLIWGRTDLRTSFDRIGTKLPHHDESMGLALHVDQNPNVHPEFRTIQGILALVDCPLERGTFLGVPGSIHYFHDYAPMAKNMGEYVELDAHSETGKILYEHKQAIPLRAGDIVTRDSRMTHANTDNISDEVRMVAMVSAGPAREEQSEALQARNDAFTTGIGSNVRDAIMHASKRPRYNDPERLQTIRQPEHLTLLGELLYGKTSYTSIK